MSSDAVTSADGVLLICEFCGEVIKHDEQRCPALEDGRCQA